MSENIFSSLHSELIAISTNDINGKIINSVNLRDVHEFIESKQHFADWAKDRLGDYREGIDFVVNQKSMKNPLGGRPQIDYIVTLNTAKHISLLERNEKGRQLRNDLIDKEEKYYGLLESMAKKTLAIEVKTKELQQERDDLLIMLKKSTHNRIATFCRNEETGEMELTQKNKLLVDIHEKYSGQYIMNCCAVSQTIHTMQAFEIPFPKDFKLADGREFKSIYTESCCDEVLTRAKFWAKIIRENGQSLEDFN